MPEIKDYDGKKKSPNRENHHDKHHNKHAKRRPHDEMSAEDETETDELNTEAQNEGTPHHTQASAATTGSTICEDEDLAAKEMIAEGAPIEETHTGKIHLEFYGSEIIRQKAPKVMDLADTVANEWMMDGQFQGLPVGNPVAQIAAAKVLRKAKDVEKKLEAKGVFAMAKMGAEYVKAEISKRKKH